jgi:hypothetical protein
MANRVKVGEQCEFSFIFDKDTDGIIDEVGNIAIIITGQNSYATLREQDDTDLTIFDKFMAPDNSTFPGTDGYIKFKYIFNDPGRYDVKLCYIKDNGTTAAGDSADAVFEKIKDDKMIEIAKITVTAYESTTNYNYEENITKDLLKDKGIA